MKTSKSYFFACIVYFLMGTLCNAQINLVPNYSFEDSLGCPSSQGEIYLTQYWRAGYGSVDYFNECSTYTAGVPLNIFGYQNAHTGAAYAGIIIFHVLAHNGREFIEVKLNDTLVINKRYCVEFYISLSDNEQYAIWDIGAYFSANGVYGHPLSQILTYVPQVTNTQGNYITNKNDWTKISGNFIAKGGENYITIGNFEDDAIIDTLFVDSSYTGPYDWRGSYYYIDDVSVILCDDTTSVFEENSVGKIEVSLFPNPAKDEITLIFKDYTGDNTVFELYDMLENKLLNIKLNVVNDQSTISINQLPQGIYLYKIKNSKGTIESDKLIIIR